jgi:hypothetical protein
MAQLYLMAFEQRMSQRVATLPGVTLLRRLRVRWKLVLPALAIAAVLPASALAADAQPVDGSRLGNLAQNPFAGNISVQAGSVDGQVKLDAGSVALKAALGDPGIDGNLQVTVPGNFVGTITTANQTLSYDLTACGPGVSLGLRGTSLSDAHLSFGDTASHPEACSGAPPTADSPLFMRQIELASQVQPAAPESDAQALLVNWLRRIVGFALLAGVLVLLIPGMPRMLSVATETSPWPRLGIGLALLLTVPLAGLLLFAIGLPIGLWWLGVIVLALYPVLLLVSMAVSGLAIGSWLSQHVHRPELPIVVTFGVGILVLSFASLLPYIGPLVTIAALIFGLGVLVLAPRSAPTVAATATGGIQAPSQPPTQEPPVPPPSQPPTQEPPVPPPSPESPVPPTVPSEPIAA